MAFGDNLLALFLKAVAGLFQKDQAQNDVLVFGGLDGAAQFVGGFPKSLLHADRFFVPVARAMLFFILVCKIIHAREFRCKPSRVYE